MRVLMLSVLVLVACVPDDRRIPAKSKQAKVRPAKARPAPSEPNAQRPPPPPKKRPAPVTSVASVASAQPSARPKPLPAQDPVLKEPFEDRFERRTLGADWRAVSGVWRIDNGRLCGQGARNRPVWLRRRLPTNARIEFEASSASSDGDIKAEFWGDGRSGATGTSYTDATSYLTILGGWKNTFHVLARLNEHGRDRREVRVKSGAGVRAQPVVANRTYLFKVERTDGRTIRWFVDDIEIHSLSDSAPLAGEGHQHFGFNDWSVRLCFDNVRVSPL